jgi:ribosomal protein L11 methyltransferase
MKSNQPLWRISVLTTGEAEDAVTELLASVTGAAVASYFDLESRTSRVSVFLEPGRFSPPTARAEVAAGLERIQGFGLDTGAATVEIGRVKREDWSESWKRHFKPMVIRNRGAGPNSAARGGAAASGRSLLVKPSWSKRRRARNQAVVILDPGLSFGTGRHPTTDFCLHEILRFAEPGVARSFLDIGTGSGILAIAAAKLGYAPVAAIDFDPECLRVAGANARRNRVQHRISLARGEVARLPLRPARQFDLVCANLISTLLIAERRRIISQLKPGGTLVLAGILADEFSQVVQSYADFKLRLKFNLVANEWCSGAFCVD